MVRNFVSIAAAAGVLLASSPASAAVYGDDLAKCLVRSTTAQDQAVLMRWIFTALSSSPEVSSLTKISAEERQGFHKAAAALYDRLLLKDCHKEAVAALKYEGSGALGSAFNTLGQVATRGLMAGPGVQAEMEKFAGYLDTENWEKLAKEAGAAP